jgi:hypothetical protein
MWKEDAMALIYSDGVEIKDTGPLRIIEELDGLYVAGSGMVIPISTRQEGEELIRDLLATQRDIN